MNYPAFKQQLKDFTVLTLNDIRKMDDRFDLRRISEWRDKGYLKVIRRGHYAFSDLEINESVLFLMANRIYSPSYISLEMALSHYHLIPEAVYGITSVATRKTSRFHTEFGDFIYRHIKPELLFGYRLVSYKSESLKIAEVEKAFLDYFYLNPHLDTADGFDALRFNVEEFSRQAEKSRLRNYLQAFDNKSLNKRVNKFLRHIHYD